MTEPSAHRERLGRAVDTVAARLAAAGLPAPRDEACRLVAAAVEADSLHLIVHADRALTPAEQQRVEAFTARRIAREPLSRILGCRAFYGRDFEITPATLDPRADSETLIDAALELAAEEGWQRRPIRILDIGTGSGCLLLTLLAELPLATGLATDVDAAALAVARRNAERLGVASRADFLCARSLEGVAGPFDLLVSNPPYVCRGDIAALEPEVRCYDPVGALDGGPDGLDVYREIAAGFTAVVRDGWVLCEVGAGQARDVGGLLARRPAPYESQLRTWKDLGGHTRTVAVRTRDRAGN